MNEIGKYIYGIINSNREETFGPCGIATKEALRRLASDEFEKETGEGGEVYTISYQDISAVVSDSEIVDYTCMPKNALARLLVRHQEVIERIMGLEYTIIPMRLGTFAQDETEVKDILNKGYTLIKDIVENINHRIEMDVVATWSDLSSVLKETGEEKEIKELKERLLANPKAVTVDEQMKVGVMIKKALDEKREKYAFKIQDALKVVSQDFRTHELMDDKMVINSAFLIDKHKKRDFEKKVEELNTDFTEKLNFRCVGPLPPYSFYTLEIKKMEFEEIDWARKKLGLMDDFATKTEIKKAHQTKALALHPDRNPNTPDIEGRFDEVTKAYKILSEYCQGDSCSFNEEDFKNNSILVKVRG